MWVLRKPVRIIAVWILLATSALAAQTEKWSEQKARDWYARQPWLVGSNYNPASAINQLEMWQADSFDPKRIDLELGWAESRHEHHARLSARPALGTGRRRL